MQFTTSPIHGSLSYRDVVKDSSSKFQPRLSQSEKSKQPEKIHTIKEETFRPKEEEKGSFSSLQRKKAADLTTEVGRKETASLETLRAAIGKLEDTVQEQFDKNLRNQIKKVGGFEKALSIDNQDYDEAVAQGTIKTRREEFHVVRKMEREEYIQLFDNYNKVKKVFEKRIAILQENINTNTFERLVLEAIVTGNVSYLTTAHRYGLPFRSWEIDNMLAARSAQLKIKAPPAELLEEAQKLGEEELSTVPSERNVTALAECCYEIDVLKEKILILNAIITHKDSSKLSRGKILECYLYFIHTLAEQVNTFNGLHTSIHEQPLLQQKAQVESYTARFRLRDKEIGRLLNTFALQFAWTPEEMQTQRVAKFPTFSTTFKQALVLLESTTAHKEKVSLEGQWLDLISPEQGRTNLARAFFKKNQLDKERETVKDNVRTRTGILDAAINTHENWIYNMQKKMAVVEADFLKIAAGSQTRIKWDVASSKLEASQKPVKPEAQKPELLPTSSSYSFLPSLPSFSWFSSSSSSSLSDESAKEAAAKVLAEQEAAKTQPKETDAASKKKKKKKKSVTTTTAT